MKPLLFLMLFLLPIRWETDFQNAKKIAKEKDELILLSFSGSDWCGPCIVFRKEYLENEQFQEMAKDNIVFFNADFPRKKKNVQSKKVVTQNEALAEKYNKEGIFPCTLLLTSDGNIIKVWKGKPDYSVDQWIREVKSLCKSRK